MAIPTGLEPVTLALEERCSIQLSYGILLLLDISIWFFYCFWERLLYGTIARLYTDCHQSKPKKQNKVEPMVTLDQVVMALPANLKSSASDNLVDKINNAASDPEIAEQIRDNFLSYTGVLKEGRFKTEDYLNAVKYISYQLLGKTNLESYSLTFPSRYTGLIAKGTASKDIAAYVSAYNKGKLVNLIREQTLVPTWVLNQDIFQKAINTQAELMISSQSDMVRMQAANSILTHLAKPKEAGPLVNIDMRETSGMNELKKALTDLATKQRDLIGSGVSTMDIAGQKLISGETYDA